MAQPSKIVASLRIKGNNKGRSLVSKQGASGVKLGRFGRPPSAVVLLPRTGSGETLKRAEILYNGTLSIPRRFGATASDSSGTCWPLAYVFSDLHSRYWCLIFINWKPWRTSAMLNLPSHRSSPQADITFNREDRRITSILHHALGHNLNAYKRSVHRYSTGFS